MTFVSLLDRRFLTGFALVVLSWNSAHADNYTLVAEDKVRLRVVEWRSSDSRYASWEALDGTYAVDDTGNLSVPVAGQVKAIGKTTEQLSDTIAAALADKAGVQSKPFVAVEVAEHAPIFVTGTVQTPGRYPFETGMTVMKAVSIAGGFLRASDGNGYFERDQIQAAGAYRTASLSRRDLLMRQARLRAEIAGENTFDIPAELVGTPNVEQEKADEMNLMRLRRVETDSQIAAEDDLVRLYSQEIESLAAKIESQKRQIGLAQKELDSATTLLSKGATSSARQFSLDRDLAATQSSMLDLEIALTRSRQSLSEAQREKTAIVNKQNAENQQELNGIDLSLTRTAIDMQVAQLMGQQAGYSQQMSQMAANAANARSGQRTFKIVRRNDDGSSATIDGTETSILLPHDLIEIGINMEEPQTASVRPQLPAQATSSPSLALDTSSGARLDVTAKRLGSSGND